MYVIEAVNQTDQAQILATTHSFYVLAPATEVGTNLIGTISPITSTLPPTPSPSCLCDFNPVKTMGISSGDLRFIMGVALGVGVPILIALSLVFWKVCRLYQLRSKDPPSLKYTPYSEPKVIPFDIRSSPSPHTASHSKRGFILESKNGNSPTYVSTPCRSTSSLWKPQGCMTPDSLTRSSLLWSSSSISGVGGSRPDSVRNLGTPAGPCIPLQPPRYSYQTPPPPPPPPLVGVSTCAGVCVHNSLASGI